MKAYRRAFDPVHCNCDNEQLPAHRRRSYSLRYCIELQQHDAYSVNEISVISICIVQRPYRHCLNRLKRQLQLFQIRCTQYKRYIPLAGAFACCLGHSDNIERVWQKCVSIYRFCSIMSDADTVKPIFSVTSRQYILIQILGWKIPLAKTLDLNPDTSEIRLV